jgi:2-iminobutanoate/2-iminopropanoate deaminase
VSPEAPSDRQVVTTDRAPEAIGPYSQAVRAGRLVFVSGQIALDPTTGQIIDGGVQAQTEQALAQLRAILEAAGTSMSAVVKTTVYLADLNDFAAMNAVYGAHFPTSAPARSTIQAARLPRDARVEIDAIAIVP